MDAGLQDAAKEAVNVGVHFAVPGDGGAARPAKGAAKYLGAGHAVQEGAHKLVSVLLAAVAKGGADLAGVVCKGAGGDDAGGGGGMELAGQGLKGAEDAEAVCVGGEVVVGFGGEEEGCEGGVKETLEGGVEEAGVAEVCETGGVGGGVGR